MLNKEICRKCVHEEFDKTWDSKDLDKRFEELWENDCEELKSISSFCWVDSGASVNGPPPEKCKYKNIHTGTCKECVERHCNECVLNKG